MTGLQSHDPAQASLAYVTVDGLKERLAPASAKAGMPAVNASGVEGGGRADYTQSRPESPAVDGVVKSGGGDAAVLTGGSSPVIPGGPGKDEGIAVISGNALKELSGPGKSPAEVATTPVRQEKLIAGKALFAVASGGAPSRSSPAFSDSSQKKSALPGRVFAAEGSQAGPEKAMAITVGESEAVRPAPPAVRITSPAAGISEKKVVAVKGKVSGYGIVSVFLVVGDRQKELLVKGGEFESEAALDIGRNLIRVETKDASGETASDMVEVIYAAPADPPKARMDLVVKLGYDVAGGPLSILRRWAPHPLSKGSGPAAAPEFKVEGGDKGGIVSVSRALPGIYTIGVGYDTIISGPVEATFEVTVFGYDQARKKNRKIGPIRLEGKGSFRAVRLLLPECVFWEDDGWFSGVMESGRTTTKYKMPEGIVWTEQD